MRAMQMRRRVQRDDLHGIVGQHRVQRAVCPRIILRGEMHSARLVHIAHGGNAHLRQGGKGAQAEITKRACPYQPDADRPHGYSPPRANCTTSASGAVARPITRSAPA
jgi:hypothetical protein